MDRTCGWRIVVRSSNHPHSQHWPIVPLLASYSSHLPCINCVFGKNRFWLSCNKVLILSNCDISLPDSWIGNHAFYLCNSYFWPSSFLGISTWVWLFCNYGAEIVMEIMPSPLWINFQPVFAEFPGSSLYCLHVLFWKFSRFFPRFQLWPILGWPSAGIHHFSKTVQELDNEISSVLLLLIGSVLLSVVRINISFSHDSFLKC